MKPNEFWNCTYREASLYVQSFLLEQKEKNKIMVALLDMLGDKLILGDVTRGFFNSKPEYISMMDQIYPEETNKQQDPRDMVRRLRAWNDVTKKGDDHGGR